MAKGIAMQLVKVAPGIELSVVANRNVNSAEQLFAQAGVSHVSAVDRPEQIDEAITRGHAVMTENALAVCQANKIDVVLEVTGAVEFGARVALEAIRHGKHLCMMNAELDGTLGPILKVYADKAGVIFTDTDGDQPGVIMNLYRFVKGIGVRPVLCGNVKGLHDPYRNPTTQLGFAAKWQQKPHMVASFADGTKISFEQAIVANATGMRVARRGMYGPNAEGMSILEVARLFPMDELLNGPGFVDYVVGAVPGPSVFVLGTHDDPVHRHYLNLYKLGEGPVYCFHTPYHLCHFEVHNTIARAVIFNDATLTPLDAPRVDVVAAAKTDLKKGQLIDGIGHYMTYGLCENADVVYRDRLLPIGLAEGCELVNDIPRDQVLTYSDVRLPAGRLCDQLRVEQNCRFFAH
jgi:predicted homoserine dehydrogenase-like protein